MKTRVLVMILAGCVGSAASDQVTTPFASMPGMTTQQLLKTLLPYDVIPYTPVVAEGVSYRASRSRGNARGMDQLYKMTRMFLDLVQPNQAVPPGVELGTDPERLLRQASDWQMLTHHYMGIAVTAAAGILLAAVIPLAGLFICCCRCAGRCGGKDEPFEKRRDKCKRVFLGILLGVLLLLIAFGVICCFVSNANVEDGANELPETLRAATQDASTYLNTTKFEFQTLLITNYRQLENALNKALNDSGDMVVNELKTVSRAFAIDNLTAIASNLFEIRRDLDEIIGNTSNLQDNASRLQVGLNSVKEELKLLIRRCGGRPACVSLVNQYDVESLSIDRQFEQLPDVQRIAGNISQLIRNGVENEIRRGQANFQNISNQVHQTVVEELAKMKLQIRNKGESLSRISNDISIHLSKYSDLVQNREVQGAINKLQAYIEDYGQYRFYVDVAMAALVLLILLCFIFGLSCGCCGKRPADPYDNEFGSKGTGASCLMAGTGLFFLSASILLLLTTAHFLVGTFGNMLACDVLTNAGKEPGTSPRNQQQIYEFIDQTFPLNGLYPPSLEGHGDVTISSVIRDCHANATLFRMLQLESVFNISAIREHPWQAPIDTLIQRLEESSLRFKVQYELLSPEAKRQLRAFANSELLGINFTHYSVLLDRDITSVNLMEMATSLNKTAADVQTFDFDSANRLRNSAVRLSQLQQGELSQMKAAARNLRQTAAHLEEHVKFNQSSLPEAIETLIGQAESAEAFLKSQGPQQLSQLAVAFAKEFKRHIDEYITRLTDHVHNKVGKCWPVSQAYNTTTGLVCEQISNPFNGFWASAGWCVLLFVPCVLISLTLASLYRKTDPYPGTLIETEFLYDAYADRDNIPLAITNSREHRRAPPYVSRNGHPYNVYSGYESDYGPPYGQSSRSSGASVAPLERNGKPASRYQDAAPRAWSGKGSPGAAAPRYTATPGLGASSEALNKPSAPSDYERPPPYYYPGPANMN